MLCFTLYLRAIFQLQAPGGLCLEERFNGGFFHYQFGGLYLKGLIHGGAYFRNFTVLIVHKETTLCSSEVAKSFKYDSGDV